MASAGNSLIADNSDTQWAEQLINALTSASNTASIFKVPGVPASNQFNNPGPRRISSWSHIEHEPEVEEPVPFSPQQYGSGQVCYNSSNNLMDNCSLRSPHQTASLPREDNSKSDKKSHRRTSSDTSLVQFFNAMYGPHNPQLMSNETFNMPFAEQTQQQHSAHTANKHAPGGTERKRSFKRQQKKQLGTHPYPQCFHSTNYTVSGYKTICHVSYVRFSDRLKQMEYTMGYTALQISLLCLIQQQVAQHIVLVLLKVSHSNRIRVSPLLFTSCGYTTDM